MRAKKAKKNEALQKREGAVGPWCCNVRRLQPYRSLIMLVLRLRRTHLPSNGERRFTTIRRKATPRAITKNPRTVQVAKQTARWCKPQDLQPCARGVSMPRVCRVPCHGKANHNHRFFKSGYMLYAVAHTHGGSKNRRSWVPY